MHMFTSHATILEAVGPPTCIDCESKIESHLTKIVDQPSTFQTHSLGYSDRIVMAFLLFLCSQLVLDSEIGMLQTIIAIS
jgi:hypothetical protein